MLTYINYFADVSNMVMQEREVCSYREQFRQRGGGEARGSTATSRQRNYPGTFGV